MRVARRILSLFIALFATSSLIAQVELVRIWPAYRDTAGLTSLSEYFGGKPGKTNQSALRSQPEERDGYYWLVRAKAPQDYAGARVQLDVVRAGSTDARTYQFSTDIEAGSQALSIGLTGTDWTDREEVPVAWRFSLYSHDGELIASAESFLWQDRPGSNHG